MKHLTSRQNPLVARARRVADGSERSLLLADGIHLVSDAWRARLAIEQAVVAHGALSDAEVAPLLVQLQDAGVEVCSATAAVMGAISPVRSASPIVALVRRPEARVDDLFAPEPALVVCAVDIQDPGNVGAIVRVAEAAGATGVAIAGQSADPFGWKALRGAMGSSFRLPVHHPCDAATFVTDARRRGCRIVATQPRGGRAPDAADLHGPIVLLVGGEGPGLPQAILDTADTRLSIPMAPEVESLNTAVCAALLVYEARRQRVGLALPHRS